MRNQEVACKLEALEQNITKQIEELLKSNLGEEWGVKELKDGVLVVGVTEEVLESRNLLECEFPLLKKNSKIGIREFVKVKRFKFGQSVDIYFGNDYIEKEGELEIGIGAFSSFKLDKEKDSTGRVNFYIGVGKLLANEELLWELKKILHKFNFDWEYLYNQR